MEKKRIVRDDGRYVLLYSSDCKCQDSSKKCCCQSAEAGESAGHSCHTAKPNNSSQPK